MSAPKTCRMIGFAAAVVVLGGMRGAAAASPLEAAPSAEVLDRLLAPVALYPDALLAQMLMCAADPGRVVQLNVWLKDNATLKGTELQKAAERAGFELGSSSSSPSPAGTPADFTRP